MKRICILLVVIMALMTGCGSSAEVDSNTQPAAEEPQVAAVDFSTAQLTPDNVKGAISNQSIKDDVTDVLINDGEIRVIVYDKDIFTPESYLQSNQSNSASVFQDLFKNPSVTAVIYQSDIDISDAYGGAQRVTAQTNTMQRADADKVQDWEYFKYEAPSQFYSVVNFELAPESDINGIHAAWAKIYE